MRRIGILPHTIVGFRTKLNLWQNYARPHFEYFSAAIILCDQTEKFESMFTKSLKRALDLPSQTPNQPLLTVLRIPSLLQIASYHIRRNYRTICSRFRKYPQSLQRLAEPLDRHAEEYIISKIRLS